MHVALHRAAGAARFGAGIHTHRCHGQHLSLRGLGVHQVVFSICWGLLAAPVTVLSWLVLEARTGKLATSMAHNLGWLLYIYILYTYRWLDAILSMIGYEVYISIGLLHAGCTSHGCQCAETSTCSDSCVAPFHCKQLQLTLRIWATSLEKKWKAIWPSRVSSPSSETWPKHRSEELSR